jgi:hypothetical protein
VEAMRGQPRFELINAILITLAFFCFDALNFSFTLLNLSVQFI